MTLILETNDLPIKEIRICNSWYCVCNKLTHISTVINTPNTHIAYAYKVLRQIQENILKYSDLDYSELAEFYAQAKKVREIISFSERS